VTDLVVPDIGDFTDVPVIDILVNVGDTVAKDAALITLESDKATLDVPASAAGTIAELCVKVGDRVSAGTLVARLTPTAGAAPAATSAAPPAAAAAPPTPPPAEKAKQEPPTTTAAPSKGSNGIHTGNGVQSQNTTVAQMPIHASPAVRRFARELGVELRLVSSSGPNGRITRDDIQNWVKQTLSNTKSGGGNGTSGGNGLQVLAWPKVDFSAFGPIERTPLSRIKRLSGPNLHRNWVMIPHVTQHDEADITDLEAFRNALNAEQRETKVTLLAFLMVAAVATLREFPDFNSSLDGDELVRKQYYHLGFAADTPQGLVVPVLRDTDRRGIFEIAGETAALAKKARDGKLAPTEMQGGTFTISSLGGIGGTAFTPIINAPEVAILGVTKASMKPIWDGKAFVPRLMVPLSLSYDHRVIDGAAAARFLVALGKRLTDLRRALL